jgi:hypothetical protein
MNGKTRNRPLTDIRKQKASASWLTKRESLAILKEKSPGGHHEKF